MRHDKVQLEGPVALIAQVVESDILPRIKLVTWTKLVIKNETHSELRREGKNIPVGEGSSLSEVEFAPSRGMIRAGERA